MEKCIAYPVVEGKIAERGLLKKTVADALNITPHALRKKIAGKTEFTWAEVVTMQQTFFPDVSKDDLMLRTEDRPA